MSAAPADQDIVVLGRISGLFGVKGWVKVASDTEKREQIFKYKPWLLSKNPDSSNADGKNWQAKEVEIGQKHGKGLICKFAGVEDRTQAEALIGLFIGVSREQLPKLRGNYYWIDLIGSSVSTVNGEDLGNISNLLETGSNDVMVVKGERERLIPFIMDECVKSVDIDAKQVVVDWDPEF